MRNTELIYAYLESEVQMGRGFNAIIAELSILTLDNNAKTVANRDKSTALECSPIAGQRIVVRWERHAHTNRYGDKI